MQSEFFEVEPESKSHKKIPEHVEYNFGEGIRELLCLYSICKRFERTGLTFEQICQEVINILPKAWKYPDIACAELTIEGKTFQTDNYKDTIWEISSDVKKQGVKIGVLKVAYLEKKPKLDEGPFRIEERLMLGVVSERLGIAHERLEAQALLEQSEHWHRLLADNVSDVIWTIDLDMRFTYFSPSITRMRGYTVEEAMMQTMEEMLTPTSYRIALKAIKEELAIEARPDKDLNRTRSLELEEICKDGSIIWVEVKMSFLRDETGRATGVLGVTREITRRKQAEETIRQLAYYDTITGLPNRTLLNDRIGVAIAHAQRDHHMLTVMMLDLDHFKEVNDTLGHRVGDSLLRHVGKRLKDVLRKTDTAARMGGDEFVVLLPNMTKIEYANTVARKILTALRKPFNVDGHEIKCTASIGIATYPLCGGCSDELIKNADMAMYRAKEQGRDRYEVFTNGALVVGVD